MAPKAATKVKPSASPAPTKKPGKPAIAAARQPTATSGKAVSSKPATKATTVAPPSKVAETVTLKTVFEQLAEAQDLTKKQGQAMAAGMVELVTSILKAGDRVRLNGLGILEVKNRPARMGRNPATGATIPIAASKKVAFRAAKELKSAV